jgi:hypothetical protein
MEPPQVREDPPFPVPQNLVDRCAGTRVRLTVVVDEAGRASTVRVLDVSDPACAPAAETGVTAWVFDPAVDYEGVPVSAPITLSARFSEVP